MPDIVTEVQYGLGKHSWEVPEDMLKKQLQVSSADG